MKQYWLFILTALQDIVFCTIDDTFANNISLDAIVVLSSFTIVLYFCLRPMLLGAYAYRTMQSRPKNCLVCTLIASILVSILTVSLSGVIPYAFSLTEVQRKMLSEIFVFSGSCLPIQAVVRYLQTYCAYNDKQRLVFIVDLVTYPPMIFGDWVAVHFNMGAFGLRVATEVCWFLSLVLLLPASKILKANDKIEWKTIGYCFYVGKDKCISQSIIRVATLFLTAMASTMGTEAYAIHSVALGITDMAESFRDSTVDYSIIELREHRDNLIKQSKVVLKKLWAPALFLPLLLEVLLVAVMHGKVDIVDTAIATAIYSLPFFVFPLYDIFAAAVTLSSVRSSAITMSIVTAVWRMVVLWLLIQLFGASIPVFGIIYFCDYLSRTIFYRVVLHREQRRREALLCTENQ